MSECGDWEIGGAVAGVVGGIIEDAHRRLLVSEGPDILLENY